MLEVEGVTTRYGELTAVDDVSLTVADGELFCLLGPSGCGKSTVLRTIAGFEEPASGDISIRGTDITGRPPHQRDCSIVFQDWALFPHKTALENVAFGLKMQGVDAAERRERAQEALDLVEVGSQAEAAPDELSGGQRQRVALARSLTVDPDLLLLDEPLSNLDRRLRESMQIELKDIQRRLETTMVYVTHDQNEAFTLADRLGVMNDGELVQVGDPGTVYDDPKSRFVEAFLGSTNFVPCRVVAVEEQPILAAPFGVRFQAPIDAGSLAQDDTIVVSLRPERLDLNPAAEVAARAVEDGGVATDEVSVPCAVVETIRRGSSVRIRLSAEETDLFVEVPVEEGIDMTAGDTVALQWATDDAVYFAETGERCR
ncbi:ABC transporter ATP-binding protein [Halorientalis regularis]|uniref:Molybdate/tungstate import ATP-binding protein WtpC n=1 Tax=Halorientalis regularis TaxID=660518 RepID=A0A1G7GGA8_9EURY|nr:ABC transporter ATP-binding protein [Halorientalis regularis]SDE87131.1 spermidine/putrescine transport system ATP-binding protein [Halorientalis regularis]